MEFRTIRRAPDGGPDDSFTPGTTLDTIEVRVLGSLVEKSLTTPDYYPLTLNALQSACNQKSSRDPVVNYDEPTIGQALERLRDKKLARRVISSESSRVDRYRHQFFEELALTQPQGAALCILMLRGPQTAGEIRQRAQRLYDFSSLNEVEDALADLLQRESPLAVRLERRAGTKEPRYSHLLSGAVDDAWSGPEPEPEQPPANERIERLENDVETLRAEVDALRQELMTFRRQFD